MRNRPLCDPRDPDTAARDAGTPIILPPREQHADPAPLLDTLARVALAIARRRVQHAHQRLPDMQE